MIAPSSDIAFTPSVKAAQAAHGSRGSCARMEAAGGFRAEVTPDLVSFLADIDTAFLATASAAGQPYAQHRGGPPGFVRPLGPNLLGFADYAGNRQYANDVRGDRKTVRLAIWAYVLDTCPYRARHTHIS